MSLVHSTDPPITLVTALADLLGQEGRAWQILNGGRTNRVWRVTPGKFANRSDVAKGKEPQFQAIVVKLYSQIGSTPLFPNDPKAEHAVLQMLAPLGLSPRPIELLHGEFGTALVYDYLTGTTWGGDLAALAKLINKVHEIPPPKGLRTISSGSDSLLRQSVEILRACKNAPAELLNQVDVLASQGRVPPLAINKLIHADPVGTNVVETRNGPILIDWQCPALGDPCEDIAIILSPYMQKMYLGKEFSFQERKTFLAAYPEPIISNRYEMLSGFFDLRMAAYAQWCIENGRGGNQADVLIELKNSEIAEI